MATLPATDASTRSACSTSSAPGNVHGGRWWTLRGRRSVRPPPAETTELAAKQAKTRSPLTDSNRRPPPYQDSDGGSVSLFASPSVALIDHARAECPGLDQVQWDVFADRRQERRAATDDDGIAEHAQLVDEAELDRRRRQAGAADRDVLVGRVERHSDLLGHRRLGEPGVAL